MWCEVCEVCQQSETEVWWGVRCVRSQLGTNSSRHTLEYTTMSTASLANDRFAAVHWAGQAAHQLTVDLARRAHQSPGRLVDEDGLRGLPLAQRTGQGQSGVVAFLVWELVRLQELLHRRQRENGLRLARQVRHWSLRPSLQTRL